MHSPGSNALMETIMLIAITREISPAFNRCELTYLERQPIDLELARRQHHRYEQCLSELGCHVHRLPAEADLPDSVFVEDVAIVLDELAIITRPGAESRRAETTSVARALGPYRYLRYLQPPAVLDGGDVLRVGKMIFVGLSSRSNPAALEQMAAWLEPLNYKLAGIPVTGCLHLKSAVTQVSRDMLLVNPEWVDVNIFQGMNLIEVDASEPHAANALLVGDRVIYPSKYPATQKRLESQGLSVIEVEVSELIKAEGAVTCCSLIFTG